MGPSTGPLPASSTPRMTGSLGAASTARGTGEQYVFVALLTGNGTDGNRRFSNKLVSSIRVTQNLRYFFKTWCSFDRLCLWSSSSSSSESLDDASEPSSSHFCRSSMSTISSSSSSASTYSTSPTSDSSSMSDSNSTSSFES
ncbi:hypothetical protein OGAPHI_000813 [Ogataea philodendri]|uniref:Uncharacterized protein n=1 Tax=Ogataea philodendri TaxID=1378263 RepID=A0A9P8PFI8_9ASCO|nr:uncharacterized protein OGAPHI_000813 [Ogataea philodendri]KAH3671102.1 hypothetical protein OGAPHI_000813 [Ogataea philodendri]